MDSQDGWDIRANPYDFYSNAELKNYYYCRCEKCKAPNKGCNKIKGKWLCKPCQGRKEW